MPFPSLAPKQEGTGLCSILRVSVATALWEVSQVPSSRGNDAEHQREAGQCSLTDLLADQPQSTGVPVNRKHASKTQDAAAAW